MTNEDPVEPSAVYAPDGSQVPYRGSRGRDLPDLPPVRLPAVVRAAALGPLLTASAAAVATVVAARGAELVGRLAWEAVRGAVGGRERQQPAGGMTVTWTRVEIRWPS